MLSCKRCGDDYYGDPHCARVCDECFEYLESVMEVDEMWMKYPPNEEEDSSEHGKEEE